MTRPPHHPTDAALASPAPFTVPARATPRRRGLSMVWKLTLAFAAIFVALEAALLFNSHEYWRRVLQEQVQAHLTGLAANRAEMVDSAVRLLKQDVAFNAQRADFRKYLTALPAGEAVDADRAASQKRLDALADGRTVYAAYLVDPQGTIVLSSLSSLVGKSVRNERSFSRGLAEPFLTIPSRPGGSRLIMNVSAPIGGSKKPLGVFVMTVSPAVLAEPLRNLPGTGASGETMLVVREEEVVRYVLPPREAPTLATVPAAEAPALAALASTGGTFLQLADYRGRPVLAASARTGYRGWTVVAKADVAEAYAPIDAALRMRILYGSLIALAGSTGVYALARRFAAPVQRLEQAAARVAAGDFAVAVPVTSRDEVGRLSQSFNEMTDAIRARVAERDRAEAALREVDRRKDNFFAILGHELRNPVSAIAAGVRMWKEAEADRQTAAHVREVIERQTGNLTRLVDDLLDVARISTGRLELRRAPARVRDLIAHAVAAARPAIEARHHRLKVELLEEQTLWVDADATRLEQVLTNLLANAAKYTPNGGRISIAERLEGDEAVILVCDNGIGLSPEALSRIFELFTQVEPSLHLRAGGLGVGLSLSRELVELHGGQLSAYSPGRDCGAEFTVRLPTIVPPSERVPQIAAPAPLPACSTRRILLVDDNEDTARLLSGLLTRRGHDVCVAYDAESALEAAPRFAPEVFLLDLGLPGMNGIELARRLRAEGFANALMVAISGYAQEQDRRQAIEGGFDHHCAKPIEIDELNGLIAAARTATA